MRITQNQQSMHTSYRITINTIMTLLHFCPSLILWNKRYFTESFQAFSPPEPVISRLLPGLSPDVLCHTSPGGAVRNFSQQVTESQELWLNDFLPYHHHAWQWVPLISSSRSKAGTLIISPLQDPHGCSQQAGKHLCLML